MFESLFQDLGLWSRSMRNPASRSHRFVPALQKESLPGSRLKPEPLSGPLDPGGHHSPPIGVAAFFVTMFLSAALLFLVEPMFAKMVLPLLGGSAAVWTTCLVFFQAMLLAGYAYAHASATLLSKRAQVAAHGAVLLAAWALLPVHVPAGWTPPLQSNPLWWLLRLLLVAVGLPFFALSATAPTLQKWFTHSGHALSGDPYFLYAASNSGSLLGLLIYPFLLEPLLRLSDQARLWTWGYGLFLPLTAGCILLVWRAPHDTGGVGEAPPDTSGEATSGYKSDRPTSGLRLRWVVLAFVPSSLMLGVTTALTTDVPPVPLLWVLPLGLYLLSFVLTFARKPRLPHIWLRRRVPFLILAAAIPIVLKGALPFAILLTVNLATLFIVAIVCHGEVSRSRPHTKYLTEFYLWISVGGVLGGAFNALLAPVIFKTVMELPIVLVLAAMLCPPGEGKRILLASAGSITFCLPSWLSSLLALSGRCSPGGVLPGRLFNLFVFGPAALCCLRFGSRPRRFGMGVAALILASQVYAGPFGHIVHRERSFYGVYRVTDDAAKNYRMLFNGSTAHGIQSLDPARACEPLSYYTREGPIGQVFEALADSPVENDVAVIGLGAGVMACYHHPHQQLTFYEIDPAVLAIARNRQYFTYMSDCGPPARVVLGDARRSLRNAPANAYGMMLLDAFSGDAIPLHLVTRQALALYLTKLAPHGVLAFHISNRYLNLHGVLGDLAGDAGLFCLMSDEEAGSEEQIRRGKFVSSWVVMSRNSNDLEGLTTDLRWRVLRARPSSRVWTDDYSNIVRILRFN